MTLRGIIIGIAVWFTAMVFAGSSWSQSPPSKTPPSTATAAFRSYDNGWGDYSQSIDYSQEIRKSLERNSETERLAIDHILADLDTKSNSEIFGLKLATDVCQEIACRGVSPDTAHRYVEAYGDKRAADDAHQTALRNTLISAATGSVSLLSLLISVLSYRRAGRSTKSAIAA